MHLPRAFDIEAAAPIGGFSRAGVIDEIALGNVSVMPGVVLPGFSPFVGQNDI